MAIRGRDGVPQAELGDDGKANAILTPNGGRGGVGAGAVLAFNWQSGGDVRQDVRQDVSGAIHAGQTPAVFEPRYYTRDNKTGGAPSDVATLTNAHKAGDSAPHVTTAIPRRLTPVECERLQGFPDSWTKYGRREDGTVVELKDGPRYRMLGNAVSKPVVQWIGKRIIGVDAAG